MKVRITALVMLLAALVLSAAARDSEKDKPKAKVYKTPQEVFDAFIPALNKRDTKTFVGCLAPEVITGMAGAHARRGVQKRILAQKGGKDGGKNDKLLKNWKGTFDVMDRHGLTEKATKDVKLTDVQKAETALSALIKDPATFLIEYQEALDKLDGSKTKEDEVKAKLSDVKTDGDKATGTVTITTRDGEIKEKFAFVKVGEGWKLDPFPSSDKDRKEEKDKKAKDK